MPIAMTFDIERPTPLEQSRLRSAFGRLGWEHLGNTAYRYPKLHQPTAIEDWFNHVVPALMLLRTFAVHLLEDGIGGVAERGEAGGGGDDSLDDGATVAVLIQAQRPPQEEKVLADGDFLSRSQNSARPRTNHELTSTCSREKIG